MLQNLLSAVDVDAADLPPAISTIISMSPFQFYFTGSRFFGSHTPESDYDFFTEPKLGLTDWLVRHGFIKDSGRDYSTEDVVEVWKHSVATIHIQIVKDAALKNEVQNLMIFDPLLQGMMGKVSKEERKALWDFAFRVVSAGRRRAMARVTVRR
jgi:hypothetical protein